MYIITVVYGIETELIVSIEHKKGNADKARWNAQREARENWKPSAIQPRRPYRFYAGHDNDFIQQKRLIILRNGRNAADIFGDKSPYAEKWHEKLLKTY